MQLVLAGTDAGAVRGGGERGARTAHASSGLGSVSSSASLLRPEVQILPDSARAAELGVSTTAIAEAARIATSGDYVQRMAKLNLADRQVSIRVGFDQATRRSRIYWATRRSWRAACARRRWPPFVMVGRR